LLELKGDKRWLFEVDYQLVMNALEKMSTGEEETTEEKIEEMKKWGEEKKHGSA